MRKAILVLSALTLLVCPVRAQSQQPSRQPPPPAEAKQPSPPAVKPDPPALPVNIRVELTIADQSGPGEPQKKTVSMIVADRSSGSIRTAGSVGRFTVELNVDAEARIMKEGTLRLNLVLQYQPRPTETDAEATNQFGRLNQRQALIVTSGKPIMISQAADPASDRKITAELTATILK